MKFITQVPSTLMALAGKSLRNSPLRFFAFFQYLKFARFNLGTFDLTWLRFHDIIIAKRLALKLKNNVERLSSLTFEWWL